MKKLALIALLVTLTLPAPAAAQGGPDRSFGQNGKVTLDLDFGRSGEAAVAPDGSLFVANNQFVAHVLRGGRLDRSFGSNGLAAIEAPAGTLFRLGDLAVDRSGRPLVFGTLVWPAVEPPPGTLYPSGPPTSAMARRFQPGGAPDSSFADNGLLVADFGLTGYFVSADRSTVGPLPVAKISDARLDNSGRIVLAIATAGGRGIGDLVRLLARLGPDGSVDPSFGQNGVAAVAGNPETGSMTLDRRGAITLAGSLAFGLDLVVNRFHPNGRPDSGLGPRGRRVYQRSGDVASVAANRSGEIAVLGSDEEGQPTIFRLDAEGDPVWGFGFDGLRWIGAKQGEPWRLLLDRRGRVLTLGRRPDLGPGVQTIQRLLPSGGVDRSFGRGGSLLTDFDPSTYEWPLELMFSGTKLVSVADGRTGPEQGAERNLLLARYTLK